jgi:hypothetical protein
VLLRVPHLLGQLAGADLAPEAIAGGVLEARTPDREGIGGHHAVEQHRADLSVDADSIAANLLILVTIFLAAMCGNPSGAQTLRVLPRDSSAIGGPAVRHGRRFEARTGTPVEEAQVPF